MLVHPLCCNDDRAGEIGRTFHFMTRHDLVLANDTQISSACAGTESNQSKLDFRFIRQTSPLKEGERHCLSAVAFMVAGGGFEPPTFWVMRSDSPFDESRTVPSSLGMLAIQSLHLPPQFRGLGSVLPYRSRDVGSTDFDE